MARASAPSSGRDAKSVVKRIEKAAAHAGEPVEESQSRMTHNCEKLAIPQRALQLNVLASEIAAKIKAAGIAKIVTRGAPGQELRCGPRRAPEVERSLPIPRRSRLSAGRRRQE